MDPTNAKPLEISDHPLFNNYFQKFPPEISELTFTNLFIWRNYYNFLFMEYNEHLLIFSENYLKKWKKPFSNKQDVFFFLPPIGQNPEKIMVDLFEEMNNIEIHRVPDCIINKIRNINSLNIIEDRNNWDYIYEKEALISLQGNTYRQKRRWLNKFMSEYNYEFHIISEDYIEKTRSLQLEWCDMNECQSNEDLMEEQKAINAALNNYSDLNLRGGILCVEDKCVGYTLGEMLNTNTMVIHIEKAHINYEGSYQAINNLFLKNCCKDAIYVNREQDLGISGLRKAKESYKPHHMVKKSIVYQKT
ncbi:MAG: DUF2156 domain-containing protein [Candidatus Hodarchaeota archaeon]